MRSTFLTQALESRAHIIRSNNPVSLPFDQLADLANTCDNLLDTVQKLRPQESLSACRQGRRQLRQARLQCEGQLAKLEKCTTIDLEYFKKCLIKEPPPPFGALAQNSSLLEEEATQLSAYLDKLDSTLLRIEEEIG